VTRLKWIAKVLRSSNYIIGTIWRYGVSGFSREERG
jgi:hypothetical protein